MKEYNHLEVLEDRANPVHKNYVSMNTESIVRGLMLSGSIKGMIGTRPMGTGASDIQRRYLSSVPHF